MGADPSDNTLVEFLATVDRCEGETAILLPRRSPGAAVPDELLWPLSWLPRGVREGTVVSVRCAIEPAAGDETRARVEGLLDRLRATRK